MISASIIKHPASYRDPSGFIFTKEGVVYRQVNRCYSESYNHLMDSGLYLELQQEGLLLAHEQVGFSTPDPNAYCIIKPEQLPFISYACEWSFSMLKDAALLTLNITQRALRYGMILKDATTFNIQLLGGKMVLIDTLSFEFYDASKPWIAYRQFCQNFLAPLALMHYTKKPLSQLMLAYPEGIPLNIASSLLPYRSKFNMHLYLHLHLNARIASEKPKTGQKAVNFSERKLTNILSSLQTATAALRLNFKSTWWDYYEEASQRSDYLIRKKEIIEKWLSGAKYSTAFDAGANEGAFSKLLTATVARVISADSDHYAIEQLYQHVKNHQLSVYPLIVDLSNPTPATGMNNEEHSSLKARVQVDLVVALALIHHLSIGKNIPFAAVASFFASIGKDLIIEFVPKSDEKVQHMLSSREDIFDWYSAENFQAVFSQFYQLKQKENIGDSGRLLYYWSR